MSMSRQLALFIGVSCLPVLAHCIELCYRAQTERIMFGPGMVPLVIVVYVVGCVAWLLLAAGAAWLVLGCRRMRVRSTWSTVLLGLAQGGVVVVLESSALGHPLLLHTGMAVFSLVIGPMLFVRSDVERQAEPKPDRVLER